jgi:N-acetylglutamate synthase/N-acetylornithine aminotransferase
MHDSISFRPLSKERTLSGLHFLSPKGFKAAGVKAGIKASGKPDLALLACDMPATAAAAKTWG